MNRWKLGTAGVLLLTLGQLTFADDMESLFDEATVKGKPVKKAEKPARTASALYYVVQAQLPKNPHPDQSLFLNHIENGDWEKALLQFPVAFEGTAFQRSENGRALFALAHFHSGMPMVGLETLFKTVDNPRQIHPEIRRLWQEAAPAEHFAWDLAEIRWAPGFSEIFPPTAEFKVITRDLSANKNVTTLKSLYARLPSNSMERARAGWQLVVAYSTTGQVEDAAKTLAQLMKADKKAVSEDLMEITAARLLFQRAHYSAAIKYYEKVGRTSEYWTDAQEEMAWSYIRRGEPGNALAISKSLVVPGIAIQAGAEGYFVHALSLLKICDYPSVIQSLGEFPKIYKERTAMLSRLAAASESAPTQKLIGLLKNERISRAQIGKEGQSLPRLVARDERLFEYAQAQKHYEDESEAAEKVYAKSLAQTGLQGHFDRLRKSALTRARTAQSASFGRVKQLARQEVDEIKEILRKLHIVEAEVIQQISVSERVIAKTRAPATEKKGVTGSKAADTLTFPDEGENWFDEVGHYKVDVKKACHATAKGKS
ncbi:MAG TPA: hypothetical protein PKC28_12315 [Bdellovibrionales bacterium]|nr:hypothetical protein [Bdellovibrionales bacterium]